jgi:uncharacterized protein YnzC (UPF0291/DUF896 family)
VEDILKRINELSQKAKQEPLSDIEKSEQAFLRKRYLQIFRGSIDNILLNTMIIDPLGNDVTPDKLKLKQIKNNKTLH